MQLFEDIVHTIATIRVLVAQLLYKVTIQASNIQTELEEACPIIWKYNKSVWSSTDSDVSYRLCSISSHYYNINIYLRDGWTALLY
jgi:hypothetical protein